MVTTAEETPGLQFVAPYAATTMGEYFMEQGRDVLVVFDDLTIHARAYREISLLLRRPPGREAYPGDIFYIDSRLLERSTHLRKELGRRVPYRSPYSGDRSAKHCWLHSYKSDFHNRWPNLPVSSTLSKRGITCDRCWQISVSCWWQESVDRLSIGSG